MSWSGQTVSILRSRLFIAYRNYPRLLPCTPFEVCYTGHLWSDSRRPISNRGSGERILRCIWRDAKVMEFIDLLKKQQFVGNVFTSTNRSDPGTGVCLATATRSNYIFQCLLGQQSGMARAPCREHTYLPDQILLNGLLVTTRLTAVDHFRQTSPI